VINKISNFPDIAWKIETESLFKVYKQAENKFIKEKYLSFSTI